MCKKKGENSEIEAMSDSDDSLSGSDSDSDSNSSNVSVESPPEDPEEPENPVDDDEEEDEVIKAIRKECEKKRDHPPPIHSEDFITDICFHPHEDYIVLANITGDAIIYKYSNEENTLTNTLELHTKSCRDIEFSHDGNLLFSTSKDQSIMLTNFETGKLVRFYEGAHDQPVYCLTVIDENLFATGDDEGCIKLWDLRQNTAQPIYRTKKNEDYISDMLSDEANKFLLCSSGDGSLTTIDLVNRRIFLQSEEYEEELTCLGLFRSETKLLAGSSKGKLFLYNWHEFGLHSDMFPGPKTAINDIIPVTENIVVTACEDGNLRALHLFPHRHLGVVGQHELSVENLDICNDGRFIASSSCNNDVKFWNIKYFEDFEQIGHKHKKHERKKEMENNLPSSKLKNASDFFSGLSGE